jgi:two-component system sensor histidine kinase KdpD
MTGMRPSGSTPDAATRVAPLRDRLTVGRPGRRIVGYAIGFVGTIGLTAALLPFRDDLTPLSKGFGYMVVVVAAAAVGGLGPGILASVFGFLTFNYFFLPPYDTFVIGRPEHVVVLFVFLGLSVLISYLLARATSRAEAAEARQEELRILQAFSAEIVAAGPGPDAYEALVWRVLDVFRFPAGSLWIRDPATTDLHEQVVVGAPPGTLTPERDETTGEPPERLPLSVGGRVLGLILLRRERDALTPQESRVMRAICDQLALVLERDRLLRAATQAEAFRQTEELRRSLLAAVSHDLRSPLAAIKATVTDLLSSETADGDATIRESLESIDLETDRLIALITNLLDISRIEGGTLHPNVQAVELTETINGAVDRVRRLWPDLSIDVRIADDASLVRADPIFLDRTLSNLLDNAAKASVDNDSLAFEVDARRSEGDVTVRVIDHGAGVPEATREQLFYAFYQLGERHPRLGTGLGLAIAKGFLASMDGRIWIEETPGGGATFAFSVPAVSAVPVR